MSQNLIPIYSLYRPDQIEELQQYVDKVTTRADHLRAALDRHLKILRAVAGKNDARNKS